MGVGGRGMGGRRKVWEVAVSEDLELPEPVEVNLARAMLRLGELDEGRSSC